MACAGIGNSLELISKLTFHELPHSCLLSKSGSSKPRRMRTLCLKSTSSVDVGIMSTTFSIESDWNNETKAGGNQRSLGFLWLQTKGLQICAT